MSVDQKRHSQLLLFSFFFLLSGIKMDILFRIAAALMLCLPISGVQLPPDMSQGLCKTTISIVELNLFFCCNCGVLVSLFFLS